MNRGVLFYNQYNKNFLFFFFTFTYPPKIIAISFKQINIYLNSKFRLKFYKIYNIYSPKHNRHSEILSKEETPLKFTC